MGLSSGDNRTVLFAIGLHEHTEPSPVLVPCATKKGTENRPLILGCISTQNRPLCYVPAAALDECERYK